MEGLRYAGYFAMVLKAYAFCGDSGTAGFCGLFFCEHVLRGPWNRLVVAGVSAGPLFLRGPCGEAARSADLRLPENPSFSVDFRGAIP